MVELAPQHFANGSTTLQWATLMLLGGAVGQSASCRCKRGLPMRWRSDAGLCANPRRDHGHRGRLIPIARTHGLFLMTPEVLHLVGIVGR